MRLALFTALLTLTALPALAKPPEIIWSRDVIKALDEAQARNVPVHITFHKDGNADCVKMHETFYKERELITASKRWVNIYCNEDTGHGSVKIDDDDWCAIIPGIKVEDHVAAWKYLKERLCKEGVTAPTTIWCDSQLKEIGRAEGLLNVKQLIEKMGEAEKKLGPGLGYDDFKFAVDAINDGNKMSNEHRVPDAIKTYKSVWKIEKKPGSKAMLQRAQDQLDRLQVAGGTALQVAFEAAAATDYERALSLMLEVLNQYKGLPIGDKAAKDYKDLKEKIEAEDKNRVKSGPKPKK